MRLAFTYRLGDGDVCAGECRTAPSWSVEIISCLRLFRFPLCGGGDDDDRDGVWNGDRNPLENVASLVCTKARTATRTMNAARLFFIVRNNIITIYIYIYKRVRLPNLSL